MHLLDDYHGIFQFCLDFTIVYIFDPSDLGSAHDLIAVLDSAGAVKFFHPFTHTKVAYVAITHVAPVINFPLDGVRIIGDVISRQKISLGI